MSLLFDAPLIAGLDYREDVISEAEEQTLIEHLVAMDCRRSASTAGSATARRGASAGTTISTTRAFLQPNPFPIGWAGLARKPRHSRACKPKISSMCSSPATIPAPASAGTATATCSRRSWASPSPRPPTCASAGGARRLRSCQPRSRAALRLPARRARHGGTGSTGSRRARSCASRSPSGHCPRKGGASLRWA